MEDRTAPADSPAGLITALLSVYDPTIKPKGLKWNVVGKTPPPSGVELFNRALADALTNQVGSQVILTRDEWKAFGVEELHRHHYIRAGDTYFEPAGESYVTINAGRPNWKQHFEDVKKLSQKSGNEEIGVVFCGGARSTPAAATVRSQRPTPRAPPRAPRAIPQRCALATALARLPLLA